MVQVKCHSQRSLCFVHPAQNGKVNRRALPEPVRTGRGRTEPATRMQRRLFACAAKAVGHEDVDDDYFAQMLATYSSLHEDSDAVSGLIAYNTRHPQDSCYLGYENEFTTKALYRLCWKWPITDDAYLTATMRKLDELGFFDEGRLGY